MKLLKDFDNKLCNRNEYIIEINHLNNKTPSHIEVKKKIAELTNLPENLISIQGTFTKYGFGKSMVHAYVYNDELSFKRFEVINKKQKNGKEKEGKKQEAK